MVPLLRLAAPALAVLMLFGSCDRVSTPQESEPISNLDLTVGVWRDSAEAARDSLRREHPFLGNITVGDTLWVRVKAEGDTSLIRSVDAYFAGSWTSVPVPVFFPVSWSDSGRQKVKVAIFTEDNQFFDSMFVLVTDRTPVARLPVLPGDGSLRVTPNSLSSIFVETQDDGRIDSLRWDLDGDGLVDTATLPADTLHLMWTLERILRARSHPVLRVMARDEDGNETSDSIALSLEVPPPSITLSGPDTVSIGDSLVFVATATASAPLQSIQWQDGSLGKSWTGFAPARDTVVAFRAIARDSMGGADTAERVVVVIRDAPVVVAQDTVRVHAGKPVRLSAGAIQRFGSIVSWGWDLDGNGSFSRGDTTAGIDTVFETAGLRRVGLSATDDDGNVGTGSLIVLVTDSVPTLAVALRRTLGPGDTATIAATSVDPDGDSLVVRIAVGSDTTTGRTRLVRFDTAGSYVVTTLVRSYTRSGKPLAGVVARDTILVVQDPPRLDLGSDTTVAWGGTWRAAAAKASDSTGTISATDWDWNGDGTWDTTVAGWNTPSHRFVADTGRVVVRARVTDDDGNRVSDSVVLRLDPAPWAVSLSAPATSQRLSDILVKLRWSDSARSGSTVRWTSNERLDTTRSLLGDADSIVVQGRLVDTLRLTAILTSPSGTVTTRTVAVALDALTEAPEIFLSGPDTVSWGDSLAIVAETIGNTDPSAIAWENQATGFVFRRIAPARDTVLQIRARLQDDLGRADSAIHTVVVVRDAPVADAGPDQIVHAGRLLRISGAATQRFGGIVEWAWDLDGDGVFRTTSPSAGIDTAWQSTGLRTVVLRVRDDDGNLDLDTMAVSVTDSVQSLAIGAVSTLAKRDSTTLVATSIDPDGDSLVVLWVVDGDTSTGSIRRVAFDSVGVHAIQAISQAYTSAGFLLATVTRSGSVLVQADPPKLDLGADTLLAWGGTWRAATATASDSTGSIVATDWDWDGNGTWDTTVTGWKTPVHRFQSDTGRVKVRARVTDDDANRVVDSLYIQVDPEPWYVSLTATTLRTRDAINVAKITWMDSSLAAATVRWTTNEGLDTTTTSLSNADSVQVRGRLVDTLHVTAEIRSPSGASTTRRISIELDPLGAPPTITISGPDTVSVGDLVNLTARIGGDVTPSSVTWWNQTSGLTAQSVAPTTSTVLVFKAGILDALGRIDSASKSVVVVSDPPVADAGTNRTLHAGQPIRLSGAATQRFGTIVQWGWDLDGDGVFATSSSSAGIDTSWESTGTYPVVLLARDDDGNVGLDTMVVTVTDAAPTLSLDIPTTVVAPGVASLYASAFDPDDDSLEVTWVVDGVTLAGASQNVSFTNGGPHSVAATVRSYTRPGGTFLAETTESASILVTSAIAVDLVHPDTVWTDTSGNGVLLKASITAPVGIQSVEWSFDGGANWSPGSLSGTHVWQPAALGSSTVVVRATDLFGSTGSDTTSILYITDRPRVDLPDSITILSGSRASLIPLEASVRFGGISLVHWQWTDIDGDSLVDQSPGGGRAISSPLEATFPPGRFVVRVQVLDDVGDMTTDSVVVSSVGIRARITKAPDSVLQGSNMHAEGSVDVWPTDSAYETGFLFDDESYDGTSTLDAPARRAGSIQLDFWASFLGSQVRATDTRIVSVVADPPRIQSFPDETIGVGVSKDLSFTATRDIGGIAAWVWDLSAVSDEGNLLLGIATHSNNTDGTLPPVEFPLLENRKVGYGVVDDNGDTTWLYRNFTVVGPPVAVDDVLGKPSRTGLDVACEMGTDCDIGSNLLLANDQIGYGLQGLPTVVGALDGAALVTNSDGGFVRLAAPSTAGEHTFRYVVSNGYLQDTGLVTLTIYENTLPAVLDTSKYPFEVAKAFSDSAGSWAPPSLSWTRNIPVPSGMEFVAFKAEYPKITGSAFLTKNIKNAAGTDSAAPQGGDILAIDPALGFRLDYGTAAWMKEEEEVVDFQFSVDTRRADGAGIPGKVTSSLITAPLRFRRYVSTSVKPTEKMKGFAASYDCAGKASFDYDVEVASISNTHPEDAILLTILDVPAANDGAGYGPGAVKGDFVSFDGKTTATIEFKQNGKTKDFEGELPTMGGNLTLHFDLGGFLDAKQQPIGPVQQKWFPTGFNRKASHTHPSIGGDFPINNACR